MILRSFCILSKFNLRKIYFLSILKKMKKIPSIVKKFINLIIRKEKKKHKKIKNKKKRIFLIILNNFF